MRLFTAHVRGREAPVLVPEGFSGGALVFGLATDDKMRIDDARFIDTSFPGFVDLMRRLGADFAAP